MPSAKNSKRSTDSLAKTSISKKAKVTKTPVEKKFDSVMSTLLDEETAVPGPESCRAMLVAAASAALKVPKDERHANQDAVFGMLMEIFDAEKGRWEARVAEANSIVEKATEERTEKMGMKDAAEAELKSQKDVVGAAMEAKSRSMEVVKESKEELSKALSLYGDAEAEKEQLVKTHEHDLAIQEITQGLKEGIYENPKDLKKHVKAVSELFESFGAEEGLIKTLPQILRRKPSERGSFDEMALQQLDEYLKNHLSSVSQMIEAADAIVTEHAAATTAWEAAVELAEDKKRESEEVLKAAEARQEQLEEALTCARKALKESTAVQKRRGSDLVMEQCGLQNIEGVSEALQFLLEYVTPIPEEKKAEEVLQEMSIDDTEKNEDTSKAKEMDVHMNLDDVPSPSKKIRQSFGLHTPTLVA